MERLSRYGAYAALGAVVAVAAMLLFGGLGGTLLTLYDEGTYAQVVEESIARGDFLTFTYGGVVFFDKPPLYFWLAGLAALVTEDRELMIRIPAAAAGLGVVIATMLLAYAYTKNAWVAVLSGLLLITTEPFVMGAREGRLDVLVSFFILLAVYGFWRGLTNQRWFMLFGAALGFAVLSKSVIAVFAIIAILALAAALKEWRWFRDRYFWLSMLLALAVTVPWHVYETALYGFEFWKNYIGYHVLERYQTNIFGSPALQTDYLFHFKTFAPLLTVLFITCTLASPVLIKRMQNMPRAGFIASLIPSLSILILFFSAETRAWSYMLPLYPFAVLTVVLGMYALIVKKA